MSVSGRSAITTAAAWIDALRTIPSSPCATSTICAAAGSREISAARSAPGAGSRRSSAGGPAAGRGSASPAGRRSPYSWPSTRAASRVAARGNILPNVMIWATRSAPYFSVT